MEIKKKREKKTNKQKQAFLFLLKWAECVLPVLHFLHKITLNHEFRSWLTWENMCPTWEIWWKLSVVWSKLPVIQ